MGRLTIETIAQLKEFVCYHRTLCDDAICRKEEGCFVNWAIEGLQELQHYKDLEEQGRLIELPCAIRSRIYFILENGEIDSQLIDNIQTALFFKDINGNLIKGFYHTKEEAEARLKELENEV